MWGEGTFIRVDARVDAVLAQDRPIHHPDSFTPSGVGGLVQAVVDRSVSRHFAPNALQALYKSPFRLE